MNIKLRLVTRFNNFLAKRFILLTLSISILSIVSMFLTILVYIKVKSAENFCTLSSYVTCTKVDASKYGALFFHIPNGLLTIIIFFIIIINSYLYIMRKKRFLLYINLFLLLITSLIGIYLLQIEFTVLYAICIFCLATLLFVLFLLYVMYNELMHDSVNS